jgi:predicted dehydrogenase
MHLPNLKSHSGAETVAICGRNRDRAEEMAKKYEIPRIFTDYREIIEKADLQALIVAVPDDLHYTITMDALDAGLHVLCEKPLALNAGQCRKMYEKAEATGVVHMVYFTWRWFPQYRYLKLLVDEGYVGDMFHCLFRYMSGYGRDAQYGWRFDGNRSNGIVGDLGTHMIDFARWYIGEITGVNANLSTFVDRPGIDGQYVEPQNDSASLLLRFRNGASGIIQVSAVANVGDRVHEQQVVLHGSSGSLETDISFKGGEIRGIKKDMEEFKTLPIPDEFRENVDRSNFLDHFTKQSVGTRLFIDAILEHRTVSPNFYDGLKVQEVVDAAIESYHSGRWVSLQ